MEGSKINRGDRAGQLPASVLCRFHQRLHFGPGIRREIAETALEHGLDSEFVGEAIAQHEKLSWMAESLLVLPLCTSVGTTPLRLSLR